MISKPPTIDDVYEFDYFMTTPGVREGLLERQAEGDPNLLVEETDDGPGLYYQTPYGEQVPLGRPVLVAQAGGGLPPGINVSGEIKPIEQSKFEKALEVTGISLEQAGRFLDNLGSVDLPVLGRMSLADLVPFVGSNKDGMSSVLQEPKWQGTPMALQAAGRGEALTRGTGMARQLTEDAKLATFEVAPLVAKPVAKAVGKASASALKRADKISPPKENN